MHNKKHWFLLVLLALYATQANAWFDCNWKRRLQVTINNTSASALTNYEIPFTINNVNFPNYVFTNIDKDFRAVDSNDSSLLNYFVELHSTSTTQYLAWVRIPTLAAGASKTIYLYYDNAAATSLSSAANTFSQTGFRVWTKQSSVDPTDRASSEAAFTAGVSAAGYGCKIITDWTNISNVNQFGPPNQTSNILWQYLAFFDTTTAGNWGFRHGSDYGRGGGMYVDDSIIEEAWNVNMWWANSYATTTQTLDNASVPLTAGTHALRSEGAEDCCDGAGSAQFKTPTGVYTNWSTAALPTRAPQCPINGVNVSTTPTNSSFTFGKTVVAYSDPINGLTNPKYIPGARARYALNISNATAAADNNSIVIVDPIPANSMLYVNDLGVAGSGPVKFTQGTPSSTLSYTFTSLASAADNLSFSNNNGASFVYTPVANANGFDAAVTHIRINPQGAFTCATTGAQPNALFEFDVGVK